MKGLFTLLGLISLFLFSLSPKSIAGTNSDLQDYLKSHDFSTVEINELVAIADDTTSSTTADSSSKFTPQQKDKIKRAAAALKSYSTLFYIGLGAELIAGIMVYAGIGRGPTMAYVSLGMALIGVALQFIAPIQIGQAGKLLEEAVSYKQNNNLLANLDLGYSQEKKEYRIGYSYHF